MHVRLYVRICMYFCMNACGWAFGWVVELGPSAGGCSSLAVLLRTSWIEVWLLRVKFGRVNSRVLQGILGVDASLRWSLHIRWKALEAVEGRVEIQARCKWVVGSLVFMRLPNHSRRAYGSLAEGVPKLPTSTMSTCDWPLTSP